MIILRSKLNFLFTMEYFLQSLWILLEFLKSLFEDEISLKVRMKSLHLLFPLFFFFYFESLDSVSGSPEQNPPFSFAENNNCSQQFLFLSDANNLGVFVDISYFVIFVNGFCCISLFWIGLLNLVFSFIFYGTMRSISQSF